MTAEETSTINLLMELFLKSRSKGEWVNLSMESKDGKGSLIFSLGNSAGSPTEQPRAWTPPPSSRPPWTRTPRRRKTPSQCRRDQKRMQEYLAKKESTDTLKTEAEEHLDVKVTAEELKDEINLEVIPAASILFYSICSKSQIQYRSRVPRHPQQSRSPKTGVVQCSSA